MPKLRAAYGIKAIADRVDHAKIIKLHPAPYIASAFPLNYREILGGLRLVTDCDGCGNSSKRLLARVCNTHHTRHRRSVIGEGNLNKVSAKAISTALAIEFLRPAP